MSEALRTVCFDCRKVLEVTVVCPSDHKVERVPADRIVADKYILDGAVGEGGVGTVFRARQINVGRGQLVAVKRLQAGLGQWSEATKETVHHPNIVRIFDQVELRDGSICIVMELLEGRDLRQELRRVGRLGEAAVRRFLFMLCGGLQAIHAVGVCHLDLKPENIFLHQEGKDRILKIIDLGMARSIGVPVTIGFTPRYAAPELRQTTPADVTMDIYSLGLILIEIIVGGDARPLSVIASDLRKEEYLYTPPLRLDKRHPGAFQPDFVALLYDGMLAERPADRPRSVGEILERLRALRRPWYDEEKLKRAVVGAQEGEAATLLEGAYDRSEVVPAQTVVLAPDAPAAPPERVRPRSGGWLLAAVGVLLLTGLSLALAGRLSQRPQVVTLPPEPVQPPIRPPAPESFPPPAPKSTQISGVRPDVPKPKRVTPLVRPPPPVRPPSPNMNELLRDVTHAFDKGMYGRVLTGTKQIRSTSECKKQPKKPLCEEALAYRLRALCRSGEKVSSEQIKKLPGGWHVIVKGDCPEVP